MKKLLLLIALFTSLCANSQQRRPYLIAKNTDKSENNITTGLLGNAYLRFNIEVKDTTKQVQIGIYDSVPGRHPHLIRVLYPEPKTLAPGVYDEYWDMTDNKGDPVPAGYYIALPQTDAIVTEWLSGNGGFLGNTEPDYTKVHRGGDFTYKVAVWDSVQKEVRGYSERSLTHEEALLSEFSARLMSPRYAVSSLYGDLLNFKTSTLAVFGVDVDSSKAYYVGYDIVNNIAEMHLFATVHNQPGFYNFQYGVPLTMDLGQFQYSSTLDLGGPYQNADHPEYCDVSVQRTGNLLFTSTLGGIQIHDKNTGQSIRNYPAIKARWLAVDRDNNLWVAGYDSTLYKYDVNPEGFLTQSMSIPVGENIYSVAAKHLSDTVAVADAGEQIKYYLTHTGQLVRTIGEYKGYYNDVRVTENKFGFNYTGSSSVSFTDRDLLVVVDRGAQRITHYTPAMQQVRRKAWISGGGSYDTDGVAGDSSRLFAGFREYHIDYTNIDSPYKAWSLKALYHKFQITETDGLYYYTFRNTTKFPNGKTYTLVEKAGGWKFAEIDTITGVRTINTTPLIYFGTTVMPNGNLIKTTYPDWNQSYNLSIATLTGYASNGDPQYSSFVPFANSPIITYKSGAKVEANRWSFMNTYMTDDGKYWFFNQSSSQTLPSDAEGDITTHVTNSGDTVGAVAFMPHVSAFTPGETGWTYNTALGTTNNYGGAIPLNWFDAGNGVSYAGTNYKAVGHFFFTSNRDEFHSSSQWAHSEVYYDKTGLAVARIGPKYAPGLVGENFPWHSGSMQYPVYQKAFGDYYRYNTDESRYGGWHVSRMRNVSSISVQQIYLGYVNPVTALQAVTIQYFDDSTLSPIHAFKLGTTATTFNTNLASVTGFTSGKVSTKMQAYYRPYNTGATSFSIATDGGVRVWVNNKLVIDEWNNKTTRTLTGSYTHLTTKPKLIELEYKGGKKTVQLLMNSTAIAKDRLMPYYNRIKTTATDRYNLLSGLHYRADSIENNKYGITVTSYGEQAGILRDTIHAARPANNQFNLSQDYANANPIQSSSLTMQTGNGVGVSNFVHQLDFDIKDGKVNSWEIAGKVNYFLAFGPMDGAKYLGVVDTANVPIVALSRWEDYEHGGIDRYMINGVKLQTRTDTINERPVRELLIRWTADDPGNIYFKLEGAYEGTVPVQGNPSIPAAFRAESYTKSGGSDFFYLNMLELYYKKD